MARLPRPSGIALIRFLERRGFIVRRIRGSHFFLRDGKQCTTCVPVHGNRPLAIGTLRSILRDVEISADDFEREWHE